MTPGVPPSTMAQGRSCAIRRRTAPSPAVCQSRSSVVVTCRPPAAIRSAGRMVSSWLCTAMTKCGARIGKGLLAKRRSSPPASSACSAEMAPCSAIRRSTVACRSPRATGVLDWVIPRGPLRKSGQQRALRQVQFAGGHPEVSLRSSLDAGCVMAIVGGVEIQRQQLVFGVLALELPGQPRLPHFAGQRLLVAFVFGQEQIARELLGECAGAGHDLSGTQIQPRRAHDRQGIDAGVAVEAGIFRRNGRLLAGARDIGQSRAGRACSPAGRWLHTGPVLAGR